MHDRTTVTPTTSCALMEPAASVTGIVDAVITANDSNARIATECVEDRLTKLKYSHDLR